MGALLPASAFDVRTMAAIATMPTVTGLNVRVHARRIVATDVVAVELCAAEGY